MIIDYKMAKKDLLSSDKGGCQLFFEHHKCYLESGYFMLLHSQLQDAKLEFQKIIDSDIRAHWANFLVELLEGNVSYYPSYLEIRNFLEIDLQILISHFKGNYIQLICNYSDFLSSINPETCKFIGRVFYKNGYKDYGEIFLNQAKDKFYNDPELHYLLSELYRDKGEKDLAIKSAKICLEILPKYYPAVQMLRTLLQ